MGGGAVRHVLLLGPTELLYGAEDAEVVVEAGARA